MKKLTVILTFMVLAYSNIMLAQVAGNIIYVEQIGKSNVFEASQIGNGNKFYLKQLSINEINQANIQQHGTSNEVYIAKDVNSLEESNYIKVIQAGRNNTVKGLNEDVSPSWAMFSGSMLDLNQSGIGNTINMNSVGNVKVLQSGFFSLASLSMIGSGNKLLLEQRNTGNEFSMDMVGNDNYSNIIQDGAYNVLSQYIEGNSKSFDVIQTGSFHELNQIETGVDGINYSVQQKGPGMKVTIVNGSLR